MGNIFLTWPLVIFCLGLGIRLGGVLFKIRHWPAADELITIGPFVSIVAVLWAITKLLLVKKSQ
jgi:hypothetical protein